MPHAYYAPLAAFAVTLATLILLTRSRLARIAIDRPNERSLHDEPVPRTGGLGIHVGILLVCAEISTGIPAILWFCFAALLIVSLVDDIRGIPVLARLSAHLLASGTVAASTLYPSYGVAAACVATLGIAWMVNLYNFMDGADGLAGGMTVFGFSFYGIAAWQTGHAGFALLNFSVAAATLAFLFFNFHPAKLFMGDAGSVPLGFLAGSLGLIGWLQNSWSWWFPLLVFSPFIVDASVTLARRAYARAAVWQAHRDHYYQRLVQMGWGHRRTALAEYGLMCICGVAALAGLRWAPSGQLALLIAMVMAYALLITAIEIAWRKFQTTKNHAA